LRGVQLQGGVVRNEDVYVPSLPHEILDIDHSSDMQPLAL